MNVTFKKIYMDLVKNKSKTILIMVTLFLGLFTVGVVDMFISFLVPQIYNAYNNANPHHAVIKTNGFDLKLVDQVRQIPGVSDVDVKNQILVRLDFGKQSLNTSFIVIGQKNSIDRITRADGSEKLPELGENEIFLERAVLGDVDVKPGDKVKVLLSGNTTREMVVKDIIYDAVTEPYTLEGDVVAYIHPKTLQNITGDSRYNELLIRVDKEMETKKGIEEVTRNVSEYVGSTGVEVTGTEVPEPGRFYASQVLDAIILIMLLLGSLSILLGVSLIINIINSILLKHIPQIGIMKAIGGTTKRISLMYFGMIFVIGLATLIVAMPASALAGYAICMALAGLLNMSTIPFTVPAELVIIEMICGIVIPLLAAFVPVRKASRTTIYNALNDNVKGASYKHIGWINKVTAMLQNPSAKWLISLRSFFRNRMRVILTIAVLVVSSAVAIAGINLQTGFQTSISEARFLIPDGVLTLNSYEEAEKVEKIAKSVEGVVEAEGWAFSPARFVEEGTGNSKKVRLTGPKPGSRIFDMKVAEQKLVSGRLINDDGSNEMVITSHLTELYPNVKVGDTLTLIINGKEQKLRVVGNMAIFGRPADPVVFVGYKYLNNLLEGENRVADLRFSCPEWSEEVQVDTADRIEKALVSNGIHVKERNLGEATLEQFTVSSSVTVYLLMFLAVLIAIVGAVGLWGTLSLNTLERAKELGVMRSMGADNNTLNRMLITEGIIMVSLACAIGFVLSVPLTLVAGNMLGEALFGDVLGFNFNLPGVLICTALFIVSAYLASIAPCRAMNRMVTREVLTYE